ncbi:MAG: Pycsar system effector family protein [Longimicrobiales bacterium]
MTTDDSMSGGDDQAPAHVGPDSHVSVSDAATVDDSGGKHKKKEKKKGKLGSSRGIETMFRTSYRTHMDLSSLADTKANIMISINGIVISIILASISPKIDANPWLVVPTSVLLVGCMASMVFAILAARPRVSSNMVSLQDVRQNRSNILFFGNFVNMSEGDFVQGLSELLQNTDQLYVNMMRDLYSLGGVLQRKFTLLRTSYTIFMWALMAGVTLYIGVFISVVAGGTSAILP